MKSNFRKIRNLFLALGLLSSGMKGQISGVVTVPGTYTSIAAAIVDLNTIGVSGPLTINIAAGYTEIAPQGGYTLNAIAGASSINQIIFQKNGAGANPLVTAYVGTATPASAGQDGVWRFSGTDFVTVDGIDITDPNISNPATMEFGYGFFKESATNGCQNNMVKNCVITLSRLNNAAGTTPSVDGSRGIDVVNATSSAHTTALTITSAAGANSNNKFYSNTIQNCNIGIALIGYADSSPFANADSGNDVGGSSALTGNTIVNFGGGGTTTAAAGIRTLAQYGLSISYNNINNNNGAGINHPQVLKGILVNAAVSANTTINNNTITVRSGGTSQALTGIENNAGSTPTTNSVIINNNLITGCTYTGATSASFNGIINFGSSSYVSISGNTFSNNSIAGTSSTGGFINNSGSATAVININNNAGSANSLSFTGGTSGSFNFIYNASGASTATLNIIGNDVRGIVYSAVASSLPVFIFNGATTITQNILNNTFTNLLLNTTGGVTFIANSVSVPANSTQNINGNAIVTGFSKTAAGGTITFYTTNASSSAGAVCNNMNNNFSNITLTGATTMAGWNNTDGGSPTKNISANTFTNWTCGSSAVTGINNNFAGPNTSVSSNTISNIVAQGVITGITFGASNSGSLSTVAFNVITNLNSITTGGAITGINIGASSITTLNINNNTVGSFTTIGASLVSGITNVLSNTSNIFGNKIYDLTSNNSGGTVNGIRSTSGTQNIYNNLIGDLKTPSANAANPLIGINLTGGTAMNLYYNSVYLNATSSGATFGSSAVLASSTPNVILTNNVFVNLSTAAGSGLTVAHRRTSTTLTSYLAASNNNLFYSGPISVSNAIFFDGTNVMPNLAYYKTFMSTRDALSVTENPNFLSVAGSNPNFLNINSAVATQIESGAAVIATIPTDYAGTTRNLSTPDIGAWEGTYPVVPVCSGQPGTSAILSSNSAVCPTVSFNLLTNVSYTTPGITYQWNASTTNSTSGFSPIVGATLSTASFTNLTATTWYQLDVTCSNSGSVFSTPVLQVTAGPPLLNAVSNLTFICSSVSANLSLSSAVSGVTYQWLSSTTNSFSGFSAIANATLATRTNTGVVGMNWFASVLTCSANPSFSTTSIPVSVSVAPTPTAAASASSASLCASSSLSLTGSTDVGTVYSWTGPSGFTSNLQNPVLTNAGSGNYAFITSLNTCTSSVSTISVTTVGRLTLNTPVTTPSNICLGGSAQLQITDVLTASRVNNYNFSPSTGVPLVTLSSGSINVIGTGNDDTPMAAPAAIGFNFTYDGNVYSQFRASPDGWILLGGGAASNQFSNVLTSTTNIPKISPYWDDLATGTTGYVRTQLLGSAPTRTLVVEWYVTIPRATGGAANSTFQTLLREGGNIVEFRYGTMGSDAFGLSSCGLTGDATTYNSVTHTGPSNSIVSANDANSTLPAPGTAYVFTPPTLTYLWSSPAAMSSTTLSAITSTPLVSTTYSVDLGYLGCVTTRTLNVAVTNPPAVNITASSLSICPGNSSSLTASGANTYSWSTGVTSTVIIVTPTLVSTIYTITGTTGPCVATNTIGINVPGNPIVNIVGSTGICTGQNASLTASGANSYLWDNGSTSSSIVTTPTANITYTVTGTDALGCSTTATQLVSVAASLSISIAGPSTICVGQTANFTGVGGVTYTWSTGPTTATLGVNPVLTTTYNVIGASGTCSNTATRVLTVSPNPTVTITGNTLTCSGISTTLTAGGASTYSWNTSALTSTISAAPTSTTNYSVIGTSSVGCIGSTTVTVATNTLPAITVARSSSVVCLTSEATFTASGANTYTWNPVQPIQAAVISVTPVGATSYTVSGTNAAGCISSATTSIATNALPNVSITPASATVCSLANLSLLGSGAITYTWNSNNTTTTAAISFTPASSTVYTLVGTNANGCVNSRTISVTTNSLPVMAFTPASATVCAQSAVDFTVSGANSYFWNNNNNTTNASTFFPSVTSVYTVTGLTTLGCQSTATVMATALPLPVISVSPSFTLVCVGSTNTFSASGATSYTWNGGGAVQGSTLAITTPSNSSYNITGTGANGCIGSSQFVVVTNALPVISISASTPTVCSMQPVQFIASGASTYTWNGGVVNDTTIVNPAVNSTYTVSGTNGTTGCVGTQTIAVSTSSLPAVIITPSSPTVCVKTPVTLTAGGAIDYSWSNGSTNLNISTTPTANVSFTLTGTDAIGCTNIATVTIVTNPLPTIVVTPPSLTVCEGETANLVASGANTYTWSANSTVSATLSIVPAFSTFYNVTGVDVNNCKSTASATINVNPCTGIASRQFAGNEVMVFPNPTTGFFTTRFEFEGEKTIFISNSVGQVVAEAVTLDMSKDFDLAGLAKGIYFIKVSSSQASGNYKIVVD